MFYAENQTSPIHHPDQQRKNLCIRRVWLQFGRAIINPSITPLISITSPWLPCPLNHEGPTAFCKHHITPQVGGFGSRKAFQPASRTREQAVLQWGWRLQHALIDMTFNCLTHCKRRREKRHQACPLWIEGKKRESLHRAYTFRPPGHN